MINVLMNVFEESRRQWFLPTKKDERKVLIKKQTSIYDDDLSKNWFAYTIVDV